MNFPRSDLPVFSLLLLANISHAAVLYKDAASTDVNNPANWSTTANAPTPDPTSIGTGDQLRFNEMFAPTAGTTHNPNLSSDLAIGSIRSDSGSSAGGTAFGNVSITGTSTLTLNGTGDGSYTTAGLVMNAGTGGTLTIAPSLVLGAPQSWVVSRSLTVNGNLSLGANTLTFYPAGSGTIILSGAIAGTKTAGNNALLLNGASTGIVRLGNPANSFTGNIEFAGGAVNILEFTSAGGLGASSAAEIRFRNTGGTAGAGSILRYIGSADTIISKQIQCDTSIGMRIESDSVGGSLTLNGTWNQTSRPLTLGGSGAGSNTLQQAFTGSGKLTKNGIGNWVLAANNTYSGGTELLGGTLSVGAMNGIGTGYLAVKNGSVFKYTGTGSETRAGTFWFDTGNAVVEVTDSLATLTLWRTGGNHSQKLIKRGAGTLRYGANGDNSGASAQVDAGILEAISSANNNFASVTINNDGAFRLGTTDGTGAALSADHQVYNTGSVTINSGGTWDQNGMAETIGTLNLNGGQIVGSGTLTIQTAINAQAGSAINGTTVTLPSSAALSFQANGTAGTFATISGTGNLTLNANPVTINVTGAPLGVGTYALVNCSGTLANNGTFGVPTITGSGLATGNVAVVSVSGNSLILTVTAPLATIAAPQTFSSPVSTTYGSASTPATATVSGTDLTADIIATAPAGLEVSSNGTDYSPTATFVQSGGSVTATPLFVRIKNNAPAGSYDSRNVTLTSVGAQTLNVATTASGNIGSPKALVVENIAALSKTFDGTTAATVTGSLRASEAFGEGSGSDGKPYAGDNLTLTCTGSTFANSAIGTGLAVTMGTFEPTGSSAGNYTVTQPTGLSLTADIVNTAVWANASGGSWPTAGNWQGGAVGIGADNTADFSTLNLTADTVVTLDGARTIGNLKFADAGETPDSNWTVNAGSGGALTLDVATGNPVVEVADQTATISAVVTGNDGLKKTGSGKLLLSAVNTYTGGTIVDGGTLRITASSGATGGIRGTLTANTGTTIEIGGTDVLGYGGSVTELNLNGATMTQTQNRNETFAGTLNLTAGKVTAASGNANAKFDLFGSATVNSYSASESSVISSPLNLRRIDTTFTVADGDAAVDLEISGPITRGSEGNGALVKAGPGTMVLSAANTYDGATTISAGTLRLGNANALQNSRVFVNTDNGLHVNGFNANTKGLGGAGRVDLGQATFTAAVDANIGYSGPLVGSGVFVKAGGYQQQLNGTSQFSGAFKINDGLLIINPTAPITGRPSLEINSTDSSDGVVIGNTVYANGTLEIGNLSGIGGKVRVDWQGGNDTRTLKVHQAAEGTFAGLMENGGTRTLAFTKAGNAKLTLTGANTYTGNTTVEDGTLLVNGSLAGTKVTVASGATLGGIGSIGGGMTVNGTLAPGSSGIGTLTLGSAPVLNGTLVSEITWDGASPSNDKVTLSAGTLTYGGTLVLSRIGSTPVANGTLDLFDAGTFSGSFNGLTLLNWNDTAKRVSFGPNGTIVISDDNAGPLARGLNLVVDKNGSAKFPLAKYASDPNGDFLSVSFVSPANGGVGFANGEITYTPNTDFVGEDSFQFSVADPSGLSSSLATVTVRVNASSGSGGSVLNVAYQAEPSPAATITFAGIPGGTYHVQVSAAPGASWTTISETPVTVPTDGTATFTHENPPSTSAFYRTQYVSGP